jgi:hypothetical protein
VDKLKELLAARGIAKAALNKMDAPQLCNLAKAFNIDPGPFAPREVRLEVGKTGAKYLVTDGFPVPKYKDGKPVEGQTSLCKNLYLRVEAIEQAIADLTEARNLLKKQS